jgi:AAA+ ATPase superfamily predicted ATPase
MQFLDRVEDLALLEDRWSSGAAELLVVWGRRRVGKTELLTRLARGRRGLVFEAAAGTVADQLRDLTNTLAEVTGSPLLREQALSSWGAALVAIGEMASERCIIVLDEFQHLVQADPGLPSLLARWWRESGRHLPLVLVLSGSEISFFQRDVLGHGSALFGRRTGQLQVTPFGYRDAALFVPQWTAEDKIRAFAIWGGMPYYLSQVNPDASLAQNILRTTLSRDGVLREEAKLLLFQELAEPRLHFSVLRAIASGDTRVSHIANCIGVDMSTVSRVLDSLSALLLVRRNVPVTATLRGRTRQTAWEILDPYLRFWFRFVMPYEERLQRAEGQQLHLEQTVLPALDEFVSRPAFEQIAQDYIRTHSAAASVGSWWGRVPTGQARRTETREIDVVGLTAQGEIAVLGSCKWTGSPMGLAEEGLLARLEPLVGPAAGGAAPQHAFFSRSGFEDGLRRLAEAEPERHVLVEPADLYA